MTSTEKKAFENVKKRKDFVLKPSDKGRNVCVMNRHYYMTMLLNLLSDTDTYEKRENNTTTKYLDELKALLMEAKEREMLSEAELKCIYNTSLAIATIYALPKVHKPT